MPRANKEPVPVYMGDIIELCCATGMIDHDGEVDECAAWDQVQDLADDDLESFLSQLIGNLVHLIQVGSSNLTGEKVSYKGFGINKGHYIEMIIKKRV